MAGRNRLYYLDQVAVRMVKEAPLYSTQPVDSPEKAAGLLSEVLRDYDREVFCVISLDSRLRPINLNIASMGILDASLVHPREVFKAVILSNASRMMLAHNHPSGGLTPSKEDIAITDKLVRLGEIMDIPVVDHIIVGEKDRYFSFKENAILQTKQTIYAERPEDIKFSGLVAQGTKQYDRESAAQKRKEEMAAITEKLESGVRDLFESSSYKAYLKTMSKFHHYSLNNTLLIAMQCPGASLVAGYKSWQKDHGRYVKKGEKGIRIIAPAPYKTIVEQDVIDRSTHERILDAQGNPMKETVEVERAGFRISTVFDISQTEGKDLPSIGVDELTGSVKDYEGMKAALIAVSPVSVIFEEVGGGAKGFYSMTTNDIHVKQGMSEVQTIKTLIHEISHAILHSPDYAKDHPEDAKKDRQTKEVEAESIAYCVLQHYDALTAADSSLDTAEYSFAYIAGWSSGKEVPELRASLQTIRDTADELITEIDGRLAEIDRERESRNQGMKCTPVSEKPVQKGMEKEETSLPCLETLARLKEQAKRNLMDRTHIETMER